VEEVYRNWTDTLYTVNTDVDVIRATKNHRFWIEGDQDWLDAKDITKGMSVRMLDGSIQKVIDIHCEEVVCDTFNFSVAKQHNYYVGKHGVLVHNDSKFAVVDKYVSTLYTVEWKDEIVYIGQTIQDGGNEWARIPDHISDGRFDEIFRSYKKPSTYESFLELYSEGYVDVGTLPMKNNFAKTELTPYELTVWEQYYINKHASTGGKPRLNKIDAITEEKYAKYWQYHDPC
jgi:hypothetical protein